MAIGDPYITVDGLKTRLNIPLDDTGDDAVLTMAVAAATESVTRHCQRQFNKAATPAARLYIPVSCDVVHIDDALLDDLTVETLVGSTWTAVDAEAWWDEPVNGVIDGVSGYPVSRLYRARGSWPTGPGPQVRVTAVWGWPAVPEAVQQATAIIAHELATQRDAPFGSGGFSDFGIVKVRDNPFAARLLHDYQRIPVAGE